MALKIYSFLVSHHHISGSLGWKSSKNFAKASRCKFTLQNILIMYIFETLVISYGHNLSVWNQSEIPEVWVTNEVTNIHTNQPLLHSLFSSFLSFLLSIHTSSLLFSPLSFYRLLAFVPDMSGLRLAAGKVTSFPLVDLFFIPSS